MASGYRVTLKRIVDNNYVLWTALALPAAFLLVHDALSRIWPGPYLRLTGLYSSWLLIVVLAISPLVLIFGPQGWIRWLKARRRYLGVACFGYAALHMAYYIKENGLDKILETFASPDFLAGWIGLTILLAMAVTSNDYAVRTMGPRWKQLQRLVYAGALLSAVHWVIAGSSKEAFLYMSPVALLMIYRTARVRFRRAGG